MHASLRFCLSVILQRIPDEDIELQLILRPVRREVIHPFIHLQIVFVEPCLDLDALSQKYGFDKDTVQTLTDRSVVVCVCVM